MRKNIALIIFIMLVLCFSTYGYSIASGEKTLIIVLDELDFSKSEKIIENNASLGLMSIKTAELYQEGSKESFFMTMAAGRRLKINGGLYQGVHNTDNGSIKVEGYNNIFKEYRYRYPAFSREISILGDTLRKSGVRTGFIGEGPSSLLIADKEGNIDKGIININYDYEWLMDKTHELFRTVDVLVVSYDTNGQQDRLQLLKKYMNEFNDLQILAFPENVKGDISYRWNKTLVPLIYKDNENKVGILTSNTTRRDGLVANLDIKAHIEAKYGVGKEANIGNEMEVIESSDIIVKNDNNLLEFLNLNIIKYVFHGYLIVTQLYILYDYIFRKKRNIQKYELIMTSILLCILISILYGVFDFHRFIITYCVITIITSLVISKILIDRGINSITTISIITNIMILIGVFFNIDMIYDSFIGYNNIVAAGRFYGLNNDIMGVLIGTAIITFYELKKLIFNYAPSVLALLYVPLLILALSGGYGANAGGYITSIALFLILSYVTLFSRSKDKKSFFILFGIGLIILMVNIYIDVNSVNTSHAGSLIERIKIFGFNELVYIIKIKLKQLLIMSILPPWSIIILFQLLFMRKFYRKEKMLFKHITETGVESFEKYYIMFIVSIIAFIINDTGAVAFTYINTYLIASLFNAYKLELWLDGDD
ncbi:hypothetical protein [Proteiniborus sp.]|uniref:hypothetical protein n=1 Tax=Proteiniborus sp. TaxID=2079015 RepID=UPI003323102A